MVVNLIKKKKREKKGKEKILTDKQKKFIEEYLVSLNATKAAIQAGYSQKTADRAGSKLLRDPLVAAEIQAAMKDREERTQITQDWVLKRLKDISDRCVQAEPVLNAEGEPIGVYKFDSAGANKATELIGKHLGMFRERLELTGKDGGPMEVCNYEQLTDEELDRLIAEKLAALGLGKNTDTEADR